MNHKRTATIVVVGGAVAAWLWAAGTSSVRVSPPPAARKSAVEKSGAELASEIARLRERLRPTATPRQNGRNLFQFSAPRPDPAPVTRPSAPREFVASPASPPPPALRLSGIAEDPGPDGPIRTAIISSPGELFLVKEDDLVTPRFRVVKISVDVVELVDVETKATLRLALAP
jgi:hypothetical protein